MPGNDPTLARFFGRDRELAQIEAFLEDPGAGLTHLRGRRRIGKTALLQQVRATPSNCFYFMGRDDERNLNELKRFAREWDDFTGRNRLARLKASALSWDDCLGDVGAHAARETLARPLVVLLDEVHWLAKKGVGFCGLLQESWADWKKHPVKLILSGSSNRFFREHTDGEMATLRGLRTHATIWVRAFQLAEVREFYFPLWTDEQICLIYMMLGGVPYYLENVRSSGNFIRAMNRALFCRDTIFLEEVDSMLILELTRVTARTRVKSILVALGQDGATEAAIVKASGLEQDYVHKILDRLLDSGIVHERSPLGAQKKNRAGVRYFMDDFYLNTYFQLLLPLASRIRGNTRALLFSELVESRAGYYVPDFSGKAFELLLYHILLEGQDDESRRTQSLFDRLELRTGRYEVGTHWEPGKTQIDLVVRGLDDREVRIIEAKWIARRVDATSSYPENPLDEQYPNALDWRRSHYLALSKEPTVGLRRRAARDGIRFLGLGDLF